MAEAEKQLFHLQMKKSTVLCLVSVLILIEISGVLKTKHPDAGLSVSQLVNKYNYTLEEHYLITEDGYKLKIHRMPYKKNNSSIAQSRIPVLLVPGVINSAADFLVLGPGKSLAFLLVDAGYDVWMGNHRGTTHSRAHVTLDPDVHREKFWDFGIDELGLIDLPAMIDYILVESGEEKLHYIGFSQGTTLPFMLISEHPEYNDKIRHISALTPAVYLSNTYSPILWLSRYYHRIFEFLWPSIGIYEFLQADGPAHKYFKVMCDEYSIFSRICLLHTQILIGFSYDEIDMERLSVIYTNTPASCSTRQISHYLQYFSTGQFKKYDFGSEKNLKIYGQEHPPAYSIENIRIPVVAYYGGKDWSITEKDVMKIMDSLPKSITSYAIVQDTFNHIDFLYSKNVDKFNKILMEELRKY